MRVREAAEEGRRGGDSSAGCGWRGLCPWRQKGLSDLVREEELEGQEIWVARCVAGPEDGLKSVVSGEMMFPGG